MGNLKDMTGKRFGKLVVVERHGSVDNRATWKCLCDCGGSRIVSGGRLRNGLVVDCGCSNAVYDERGEIWKPVIGYEGKYEVSSHGRVKSCKRFRKGKGGAPTLICEKLMIPSRDHSGYLKVTLSDGINLKNWSVHQLVARAFIPNSEGLSQINHKDENKENNYASNLEWCTAAYNNSYGTRLERIVKKRKDTGKPIVGPKGTERLHFKSARQASRELGICASQITAVCRGRGKTAGGFTWRYAPRKEREKMTDKGRKVTLCENEPTCQTILRWLEGDAPEECRECGDGLWEELMEAWVSWGRRKGGGDGEVS